MKLSVAEFGVRLVKAKWRESVYLWISVSPEDNWGRAKMEKFVIPKGRET